MLHADLDTLLSLSCAAALVLALSGCPDSDAGLVLNEFVADNATGMTDEAGEFVDWIEIHNITDDTIDLAGFAISDSAGDPLKHTFTGELEVAAGGYLLLYADEDVEEGPAHLRFKLDKDGGEGIYLSRMLEDGGLEQVDAVEFSAQEVDTSSARLPDGTGDWTDGSSPTPGSPNG